MITPLKNKVRRALPYGIAGYLGFSVFFGALGVIVEPNSLLFAGLLISGFLVFAGLLVVAVAALGGYYIL